MINLLIRLHSQLCLSPEKDMIDHIGICMKGLFVVESKFYLTTEMFSVNNWSWLRTELFEMGDI